MDAKGVINLVGRTWPRYLTTVGYINTTDQLKHLIPVYREHLPILRKKPKFHYWFHPELVLAIVYSETPQLGKVIRAWLDLAPITQPIIMGEIVSEQQMETGQEDEINQLIQSYVEEVDLCNK